MSATPGSTDRNADSQASPKLTKSEAWAWDSAARVLTNLPGNPDAGDV